MVTLRAQFEEWLSEHYPAHGTTRRLPSYQVSPLILGGSHQDVVDGWRAGDSAPYRVRRCIKEIVEWWDPQVILEHRCRQAVEISLAAGRRHQQLFGHAPDGGPLPAWEERVIARHERVYGVSGAVVGSQVSLEDMMGRAA